MTALLAEDVAVATSRRLHRINLNIDHELYEWVNAQRYQDHVSTSDRVRALLELSREDAELSRRVAAKASEIARARAIDT